MKLEDFPEFQSAVDKLRTLESQLHDGENRKAAIENEANAASPATRIAFHTDWQNEFSRIERGAPLVIEKIQDAKQELDRVRGQCSLQICQEVRPAFVQQTKRVLRALKELCDANEQLARLRSELDGQGVVTGSIAHSIFPGVDRWSDQYGGRVSAYQNWIRENFPELKDETY